MTNTEQKADVCTNGGLRDWSEFSRKGQADLEKEDIQKGREYLPMDVYVDPRATTEHFHAPLIVERWKQMH
jgi:hypothetical protein